MANVYVRSGAGGSGTGADWANAYTTLAAAFSAKAAGDTFWVAADHAEATNANVTLTSPGTANSPCRVICAIHTGSVPPVSADVRTTGVVSCGAGDYKVNFSNGNTYWYGITFKSGTGASVNGIDIDGIGWNYFKNCALWKPGTVGNSSAIFIRPSNSSDSWGVELNNTTMRIGDYNDSICLSNRVVWRNTPSAITTTSAFDTPYNLFIFGQVSQVLLDGVDFSSSATDNLFQAVVGNGLFTFQNCKLNALTVISMLGVLSGREANLIRTDSVGNNYRSERHTYYADQTTETTIVRTGGAIDGGVTPYAWKVITGANVSWVRPFECLPMSTWNDTTGSNVTATIYGVWGGGSVPTSDDLWPIWSYMGSSASPLANLSGDFEVLGTPANWDTDGSTWGGGTTAFKMSRTFSSPQPAMKGPVSATVKVARPSATFYLDPKIVLT